MARVELGDLTVGQGAMLAIVGRAGSGKSAMARALAAQRGTLLGPAADAAELAAALARGADLVVADEPGSTRDPAIQHELLAALQLAHRDRRATTVILTADLRLPLAMGLETAVLAGGHIVERGHIDDLMIRAAHDVTRQMVAASRPRSRTMARPPIGDGLLAFDAVTRRTTDWSGWPFRRGHAPPALSNLSFTVRRGQAIGLLGRTGAGKSLLLRLAAGLVRPSSGRITLAGRRYRGIPTDGRERIAMLFPDPHAAFNPGLPVGLSLTEPLHVEEQLLVDEQVGVLVEAVRVVGLSPGVLDKLPGRFSPFDLQRLALARAIAGRPTLIMLDEPTARLDPVAAAEFILLFNRIRSDYGLTVLWASREFALLRQFCDRIAVLDRGEIVETGTPGGLFETGSHPATRTLVVPRYPEPPPPMPPKAEPEPEPVTPPQPEPQPEAAAAPEPPVSADDSPDEPGESRQVEPVAAGGRDGAGRIEPANADGESDDHRALRHVEGA
jgi:ABC-type glutathione transport system ATPase component